MNMYNVPVILPVHTCVSIYVFYMLGVYFKCHVKLGHWHTWQGSVLMRLWCTKYKDTDWHSAWNQR